MKKVLVILFCLSFHASTFAQMKPDGDNPKAIYKKFPYQFQFTPAIAFVDGDMGWTDFYLNDFMIDHTGRMWIAGNHGLSYSDDNGLNWHVSTSRCAIFSVFETRQHTLLCSSTNEYVMRSVNHGQIWKSNKVKNVGSGRSSHGERYDDIFYIQVDDKRIIRTCQYSDILLISDDDGITWKKNKAPDHPESIVNLGDSVLVMFTYDQMYLSSDRGESWQQQSKGLPTRTQPPNGSYTGVIDCGVATREGTIIALTEEKENKELFHFAYYFDLKSREWIRDTSNRKYTWGQSAIYDGGNGRLLTYDHNTWEMSVSFDKGRTWGVFYKAKHTWAFPYAFWPDGNNVYFIAYTEVSVLHFPEKCSTHSLDSLHKKLADERGTADIEIFPVDPRIKSDKYDDAFFCIYQMCSDSTNGDSGFIMHVPNDTIISEINILLRDEGSIQIVETHPLEIKLEAGDYELWYHNEKYRGCYFLNVVLKNGAMEQQTGTTCIFY